jgi:hypothetical protein
MSPRGVAPVGPATAKEPFRIDPAAVGYFDISGYYDILVGMTSRAADTDRVRGAVPKVRRRDVRRGFP